MSIEGMLTLRCDSCVALGGSIGVNGFVDGERYIQTRQKMIYAALDVGGWSEEWTGDGVKHYCAECASKRTGFPKEPMIRIMNAGDQR